MRFFGERPYAQVSTTDIAQAAGVARGLINHYFGLKRDLYLEVVRRMVLLPKFDLAEKATGTLRERVEKSVDWYLNAVGAHGKTFVAVTGAGGIGDDPEVERILAAADDIAASKVLELVGLLADSGSEQQQRAAIRAYGGLVKATVKEWVRSATLSREQAHLLLSEALISIVVEVLPKLIHGAHPAGSADRRP